MSAAAILELISAGAEALPALIGLFQKAQGGGTVTEAEVLAATANYTAARAKLVAAINAAGGSAT